MNTLNKFYKLPACFRTLVSMAFNKDANEIAKPSELLSKLRAYMSVLQNVENYVHLGMS